MELYQIVALQDPKIPVIQICTVCRRPAQPFQLRPRPLRGGPRAMYLVDHIPKDRCFMWGNHTQVGSMEYPHIHSYVLLTTGEKKPITGISSLHPISYRHNKLQTTSYGV